MIAHVAMYTIKAEHKILLPISILRINVIMQLIIICPLGNCINMSLKRML